MNNDLACRVVDACLQIGITEFCVAPGSRNAPLVYALHSLDGIKIYYWSEERSAGFFALGRIKATGKPVAVITTSGTAAAELLPAAMSGHYLGLPLLMITADRPRRFRKTGAPQTAEQVNLFGCYADFTIDAANEEEFDASDWSCTGPAHLNICFEEPSEAECKRIMPRNSNIAENKGKGVEKSSPASQRRPEHELQIFVEFIRTSRFPLVVLGSLPAQCREAAVLFLLALQAPVYAECSSGLREDGRIEHLRIRNVDKLWERSNIASYPIDGILRIGEIPTARLWRDLEEQAAPIPVCSISNLPFSGLSRAGVLCPPLEVFFREAALLPGNRNYDFQKWHRVDREFYSKLSDLFVEEPASEPSLFHALSCRIPKQSVVYVGNSLPIREWDLAATYEDRGFKVHASRGVNGIDGQVSTFLGLCSPETDNWAILGDLTMLYDMAGPWILSQLKDCSVTIAVINNRGGQIFSRMYLMPAFTNPHTLSFEGLAKFWNMDYELWTKIPEEISRSAGHRFIEIQPDSEATRRFWHKLIK